MAGDAPAAPTASNDATTTNTAPPTTAEYRKSQQRVRELIEKRRMVERKLVCFHGPCFFAFGADRRQSQIEEGIKEKELAYLESTPGGNIITGFDNYLKGQSGAAAQRRKAGPIDNNRVFTKSSISYKPNPVRLHKLRPTLFIRKR